MSSATRRVPIILSLVLLVPAVLLAGAVLLLESERTERWVESRIGALIDREVEVNGIDVSLRWPLAVDIERLRIGNPSWAKTPDLLDATGLHARIAIPPLFSRRLVVPYFGARTAAFGLEQDGDRATWRFGEGERGESRVQLVRVALEKGKVAYRDSKTNTELDIDVTGTLGADGELKLTAQGKFKGEKAKGSARVPALKLSPDTPVDIEAQVSVGKSEISATGSVAAKLETLDLELRLAGPSLSALDKLFGLKLPQTPPYRVAGRLRHSGAEWIFSPFEGKVGDSDLRGSVAYRTGGARPFLKADLQSKLLDFDDLGPLVGAPPKTGAGETANAKQKQQARQQAARSEVLPRERFNTERWKAMDAEVKLEAKRVLRPKQLPIDALATHIVLMDAVMRLQPLTFSVAKGRISAGIALDARKHPLHGEADIDVQGLALSALFPTAKEMRDALGTLYGRAKLAGKGAAVGELLGTSNGRVSLAVDGGRINLLLVELLGLDIAEAATLLGARKREQAGLRCAVGDFAVSDGVMRPETFLIDTTDTVVKVDGTIDLARERLDLVTYPEPKDMSLFALRSPMQLTGPFKDPSVRPKAGPIAARGAAAAALAAVNPLLALFAFVETGPGEDSDCGALLAEAKAKGAVKKKP